MSTLSSPVKAISELRIHRLPAGQKVAATAAIRYDNNTFIVGLDGTIYSNRVHDRSFYPLSAYGWAVNMVRALARLGVLKRKDAEAHIAAAKAVDKAESNRSAAASFEHDARLLGIKLTAAQKRAIKKLK